MKRYFDIILALLLVVPVLADCGGGGGTASQDNRPWALVWEDNFDRPTLNTDDWAAVQDLNWNNEDQAWEDDPMIIRSSPSA